MLRLVLLRTLDSFFRHPILNLLPLVMLLAAGLSYIVLSPPVYRAQGTMYAQNQPLLTSLASGANQGYAWTSDAQRTVDNLQELLQSDAFVRSAIQRTALESKMGEGPVVAEQTISDFRKAITVFPIGNNLVSITAEYENPQIVQQLVIAVVDAYIQWKVNAERQESVVARDFFANLIKPYQQQLQRSRDNLEAYLRDNPEPLRGQRPLEQQMQIDALQAEVNAAQDRVQQTMEKEESALLAMTKAETEVKQLYKLVDAPTVPLRDSRKLSDHARTVGIFGVIGLFLTIAAVVGGWLIDRSFRLAIDVKHQLQLPILAVIPQMSTAEAAAPATQRVVNTKSEPANATSMPNPKPLR